jgi:hypothetical protein
MKYIKLLPIFVVFFLLVGTISAFEFDNVKDYDSVNKVVDIRNSVFGIKTSQVAEVQLMTDLNIYVMPGEDRLVAQFKLSNYDKKYSNAFKDMEFYDIKRNNAKINRQFTYKYVESITQRQIPMSESTCATCKVEIKGYKTEEVVNWKEFNSLSELPDGDVVIGIFTDVKPGDYVEWIPTFFGVRINEWATWTASLNVGLVSYYTLNINDTTVIDSVGNNNGTAVGILQGIPAKIANGTVHDGTGSYINISNDGTGLFDLTSFTFSMWVNISDLNQNSYLIDRRVGGSDTDSPYYILFNGASDKIIFHTTTAISDENSILSSELKDDQNYLVTVTFNQTTGEKNLYINGLLNTTADVGDELTLHFYDATHTLIGGYSDRSTSNTDWRGMIDEVGLWNRSLTATEVNDLYNGGSGLTYVSSPTTNFDIDVSLDAPSNGASIVGTSVQFNSTGTFTNINSTNATLQVWYSNGSLLNQTSKVVLGNSSNTTSTTLVNMPINTFNWNVFWCGINETSNTICSYADSNYSLIITSFEETGTSYDATVYETQNSTYELNISVTGSADIFAATLNYSGISYPIDTIQDLGSGNFLIRKTIDIPSVGVVNASKQFNFIITLDEGTGFSSAISTLQTQTVAVVNVTQGETPLILNFTVYNQETLTKINAKMDITFNWYLGSGTQLENESYAEPFKTSFHYSTLPSFRNFTTSINLNLNNVSTDSNNTFNDKNYDFEKLILTQKTTNIPLYILGSGNGTDVIIEVKDIGFIPLEDYLVKVYRFYSSDNTFKLVESEKTDVFGQISARLIEKSVKYKFEFYDENNNLVKTVPNSIIVCQSTITVCKAQFVVGTETDDSARFQNGTDRTYFLTFNNVTNSTTLIWNDNSGLGPTWRLEISKRLFNGTTIVYNQTSTADYGSLSFDVGKTKATYSAQAFRRVGSIETRIAEISFEIGSLIKIFGLEGLMISFLLVFTMVLLGLYSPSIGIGLYLLSIFLLGTIDIIYISPAILIAEFVIGVLAIWALKQ